MRRFVNIDNQILACNGPAEDFYAKWPKPTVIVSDGPYGVSGYKGDLPTADGLVHWYTDHVRQWSLFSTPRTTLWFWNTELGWATVHPLLVECGWQYKCCNVWDKGLGHVAGNTNTGTLTRLPVVSEVCAQYVRKAEFVVDGEVVGMREWLRHEWKRSGLPWRLANEACGVAATATRKWLSSDHLWYMPSGEMVERLAAYANEHGDPDRRPYFGGYSAQAWDALRPVFHCPFGVTNVWSTAQLSGKERLKNGSKAAHGNQKPLELVRRLVEISSDEGDVVWDPFGGLLTTALACMETGRRCCAAEKDNEVFDLGSRRLKEAFGWRE